MLIFIHHFSIDTQTSLLNRIELNDIHLKSIVRYTFFLTENVKIKIIHLIKNHFDRSGF